MYNILILNKIYIGNIHSEEDAKSSPNSKTRIKTFAINYKDCHSNAPKNKTKQNSYENLRGIKNDISHLLLFCLKQRVI